MIFISYKCEFVGKINEIHIFINEKSNREFSKYPGIYPSPKLNRDPGIPGIKPYL